MNKQATIFLVFSIIFLVFSIIEIYFCFKSEKYRKYFKGIPVFLLIIAAIIIMPNEPLIYCGLICGLIGDLFLISWNKQMFFVGTCFFLLEHILIATKLYLMSNISFPYPFYLILVGSLFLILTIGYLVLSKFMKTPYMILSTLYAFILLLNLVSSIAFLIINKNMVLLSFIIGYAIFISSDFLVMQKRFIKKMKVHQPAIMITYYIAQFLILLTFVIPLF